MGFEEKDRTWLDAVIDGADAFEAEAKRTEARRVALEKVLGEVGDLSDELAKASRDLSIEWPEEEKKGFWDKQKKTMQWMTGDRDEEVDTVHDLRGDFRVDPEKAARVQKLHMKLVAIQTRMEEARDEEGNPLFTARDIERELWSPLIRADIIPSNAVADKYSQEAQVWKGACEIYQKKLEAYTETASKFDQVQRGLRIAGDTVQLVGTFAAESIKAANFDALSLSRAEKEEFANIKGGVEDKLGGESVKGLDDQQLNQLATEKGIDPQTLKDYQTHTELLDKAAVANRDLAYTTLAVGVVQSGLSIADKALDKPSQIDGFKIAELVYDQLEKTAINSITAATSHVKQSDPALAKSDGFKTMMGQVGNLTKYGFKAGKVVFRAAEMASANDPATVKQAAFAMVTSIAGAVGNAIAAFDRAGAVPPEGNGTGGEFTKIGAYVEAGILATSNIGKITAEIVDAKKNNREVNVGVIVAAIGLAAIGPVMAGTYDPLADVSRGDTGTRDEDTGVGGEIGAFTETDEEKKSRLNSLASSIQGMGSRQVDPSKLMAAFKGKPTSEGLMKAELAKKLAKEEEAAKKKEIESFRSSLEDPKERAKFLASIHDQLDRESGAMKKLIEEATPDRDDLQDEEKAKKAMEAVEKLIAEAAALNAKWDLVNSLTSGGVGILVAALPVAGLAAAIQKLAMDVAILVRKSIELNTWIDNMALTYGNSSVYGPAIAGRLASAKVQVSQQTARVVFDTIGVISESCKLADVMGVATGLSIANNMARALTEYAFKMHKEIECSRGWQLYKDARANPGDRKLARKAMKWNSTLSKCVLAYGIVMDGDPIAREVGRSCGLTPEILADQNNVCGRVVVYFETLYSDDPVVLRRVPLVKDWHPPGTPVVAFDSWVRFKAAAASRAVPPLADASTQTPLIDRHFSRLRDLVGIDGDYPGARDARFPSEKEVELPDPEVPTLKIRTPVRATDDYGTWLTQTRAELVGLVSALNSYRPLVGPCPDDIDPKSRWTAGAHHGGMQDVVDSFAAQALMMQGEIDFDIQQREALLKRIEARRGLMQAGTALPKDEDEKPKEKDEDK